MFLLAEYRAVRFLADPLSRKIRQVVNNKHSREYVLEDQAEWIHV